MSEPQYADYTKLPREPLGLRANVWWQTDPRGLLFHLARYKFVSKMLTGKDNVLEIGCGDAFGTRLVRQTVPNVTAIDFDETFITDAKKRQNRAFHLELIVHDILSGPVIYAHREKYQAAYALDVLEHIDGQNELLFFENICASIEPEGTLIIGTPSAESQIYASEGSKAGHVNCKTGEQLRQLMARYFHSVFLFSMNDEVVHTGYAPMAHYLFAIGVSKKLT